MTNWLAHADGLKNKVQWLDWWAVTDLPHQESGVWVSVKDEWVKGSKNTTEGEKLNIKVKGKREADGEKVYKLDRSTQSHLQHSCLIHSRTGGTHSTWNKETN